MDRTIITQKNLVQQIQVKTFGDKAQIDGTTANNTPPPTVVEKPDDLIARLIKYVPTEVIAVYMVVSAIAQTAPEDSRVYYIWGSLIFGLIGTYLWLVKRTTDAKSTQILLSCVAFMAWAVTVSEMPFYMPGTLKALVAPVVTFLISAVKP